MPQRSEPSYIRHRGEQSLIKIKGGDHHHAKRRWVVERNKFMIQQVQKAIFELVVVVCLGSYYYLYGNNSGFIQIAGRLLCPALLQSPCPLPRQPLPIQYPQVINPDFIITASSIIIDLGGSVTDILFNIYSIGGDYVFYEARWIARLGISKSQVKYFVFEMSFL